MPAEVPTLVFKGLAEGLTLHAAEREPTDEPGLVDRFERILGQRPHPNQVESVLREVRDADFVRTPEDADEGVHQLTQAGARRLAAYRRMPASFEASLVELFSIPPARREESPPEGSAPSAPGASDQLAGDGGGWVAAALAGIPTDVEMQAPYARVSLDRDPAHRAWTLRVERHEPGRYEGADVCPLTFLYEAATRLLARARGPPPRASAPG